MRDQIITQRQDLKYLSWDKIRNSSGTAGSFLKAYSELNGVKTYYKLSNYDAFKGIVGHECVNEIIVDRLLSYWGVDHLSYQLIHADILVNSAPVTTWLCASTDFKKPSETKVALDVYYQLERHDGESPFAFCVRNGWEAYIYEMLTLDFIILNRDRHGANIEVLRNQKAKTIRLAPLFDHGLSLLFSCTGEGALKKADPLEDKRVNSFIGSQSTLDNLRLIPSDKRPKLNPLNEKAIPMLMEGLEDALPAAWREKIGEMLLLRWKAYEDFCYQG